MTQRRRSRLILGAIVFVISLVLVIAHQVRPKVQTLRLVDGTVVQFLGLTEGTNHWNPRTSFLVRAIHRVPGIRSALIPLLPKSASSQPSMAILPEPGGALWFFVKQEPLFGELVFRCVNKEGMSAGASGNVEFRSGTNATAVWLQANDGWEITNIHSIEIYLREMPLRGVMNSPFTPVSEMDVYSGTKVGEFIVPKSNQLVMSHE